MGKADKINQFVQGSVWIWENKNEKKSGVQSDACPVLVISNNTFNQHSTAVNCIAITSVLSDSPVHVPIYLTKPSYIQCEQLHTIPKNELTTYKGMVADDILDLIKDKLKTQFSMETDRILDYLLSLKNTADQINTKIEPNILESIKSSTAKLNEKADNGFGIQKIETDIMLFIENVNEKLNKIALSLQTAEPSGTKQVSADSPVKDKVTKRSNRYYSDEDKMFIADRRNSLDTLMEKYGYNRAMASKMRGYFRKILANNNIEAAKTIVPQKKQKPAPAEKKRIIYTDEDKRFILDDATTIDDIMKRFGFKKKSMAYSAKGYIKRNFNK
jgi:mRNA-degrading endonuclease toxin of MazEF toxin-antitoxin module